MDAGPATALVLPNLDPGPARCVTGPVPGGAGFASVASRELEPISVARDGPDLEVQLTLGRVAVLTLAP